MSLILYSIAIYLACSYRERESFLFYNLYIQNEEYLEITKFT